MNKEERLRAALKLAIGWAESGKVPVKAVVDGWRTALADPTPCATEERLPGERK